MESHIVLALTKEEQVELYNLVIGGILWLPDGNRFPFYQRLAKKLLNAQPGIVDTGTGIVS